MNLTTVSLSPVNGVVLVFEGATRVATHNPTEEDFIDPYGEIVPPGDWCAPGWRFKQFYEVWPGTYLERE
jgi:hypothetical protein